jgi:hypothetical protein
MNYRRKYLVWAAVLAVASTLPGGAATARVARDWAGSPAVVQVDTASDVFAVGDVHGDRDRLVRLLGAAGLVDRGAHWSGDKSLLVFTGDLIDKGPKGPEVLLLLRALRDEAAQAGGRVIVLMGNHENDFLRNPESEKAKEFALQLRDAGVDAKAAAACTGELGAFLCGLPFAARVNDWFFSHAGNSGGRTLPQLSADLAGGVDHDGYDTVQLTGANSLIQAKLQWFQSAATLSSYAAALGVKHIVQGHQHAVMRFPDGKERKLGEIYQWRGTLFMIDTGMSQDIDDSMGALLRMRSGEADAICPDGRTMKLWDAAKKTDASKGVRCSK